MRGRKRTALRWIVVPLLAVAGGLYLVDLASAQLPSPGNNAVYNASGIVVLSPAFIDASIFLPPLGQATDVCDAIFQILSGNPAFLQHGYPSVGAVIDTRGISGAGNLRCTHGSPWKEGTTTVAAPSTILLPAGTIVIPSKWVLPNNTHLIGEGDALNPPPATPVASGTILQANFSSGDMIDLGSSILCPLAGGIATCNSVSVEHLILDGQGQVINRRVAHPFNFATLNDA